MLGKFRIRGGSTLAIALGAGLVVAGFGASAQPAFAQKEKQAKSPYSPAFQAAAAPLQAKVDAATPLQQRVASGDAAAKAQLDAALAGVPAMVVQTEAAAKSPQEKVIAGQFALQVGVMTNDLKMAERGARAMLASGQLNPTQAQKVQATLAKITAVGQVDPVEQAVSNYVKANNPQAALAELRKGVAARAAAGQQAPATWYERALQIADSSNNGQEALYWGTQRAELYPSSLSWLGAAQALKKYGNITDPQDKLDLFRLMARSGALSSEPRFTSREYYDYAEVANLRGQYAEAVKVIDQGMSSGALTSSQVGNLRAAANRRVAEDRASLASQESRARAAADGVPALASADLYMSFGEAAKAEEMYKLALQKGRIDKDRALTRLGIAQFDQGKYAEARESFSKVTGARTQLARLWGVLVKQKSPA